ncbi:MAG: pantetheine-phosphate adenylyltransferase [Bacteroidales bacterium]|nr:pantetheine-phosphate adenylyltransferase [Bacteroidales bacterium]
MTPRTALFPGSFDPFTIGHKAIVLRALRLFDHVIVAIGVNSDKQYMFSVEERKARILDFLDGVAGVSICSYNDMTVDCCRRLGVEFIIRGIRNVDDFDYERQVAAVNRHLAPEIDTVFFLSDTHMEHISSTIERERLLHEVRLSNNIC